MFYCKYRLCIDEYNMLLPNFSKNVTQQFLLVVSLVKVDKKCHLGGGEGGSKKSGKSVTYYLNGP